MENQTPTIEAAIEQAIRAAVLKVLGEAAAPMPEPTPKSDKLCMTVKELAARLGISHPKANDLTHIDGFPVLLVGRRRLIPIDAFSSWLTENHGKVV